MIVRFWSFLCFGVLLAAAHKSDGNSANEADTPYLELDEPAEGYHGLVRENETEVEVTPPIRARGPLCSYLILNNKHHGEAPFEIMSAERGAARLRVRYPLNCEKRRNYKFDIAAVGCDGTYSNTVPVHITVSDVNEYAPVFTQPSYARAVDEARLYDAVVRVEAADRDCTPHYGDVCKYEIVDGLDEPFAVDNEGVIRNTLPLEYDRQHTHVLSVVAYDCGMRRSQPATVTVKVNKPCKAGWKGLAERVDYAPGSGPLALFPAARLVTCSSDERCPGVTKIQALVTLQASRAGTGCDRDTYSLHAQKMLCGLDSETVDLLPSPGPGSEWAKALKPDIGRDGEQMFTFDGASTAAVVPESLLPHSLGSTLGISAWMRHAPPPDHDRHRKEHLLCLADDHKMNRHHYALFVRNCRLILLLRRDFGDADLNIFRPAEWRWQLPEVCDNEWHHYSVEVRFPSVQLFVDGEPWRAADGAGPEVIDDWPLHPAHGVNTTMVVGACWQGTSSDMKHHFHGWLAGLGVSRAPPPPAALRCVARCREGLALAPRERAAAERHVFLRSLSVEGDGAGEVETLLRKVAYADARAAPTPGRRNVRVTTTVTCDNGRILPARAAESYVMVLQPPTPTVRLQGSAELARDYRAFRAGLKVFPELEVQGRVDPTTEKLDSCVVSVYPALNPDHEALALPPPPAAPAPAAPAPAGPAPAAPAPAVRAALTRDGASLVGADTLANYQQVLRSLEYSNKKPAYYLNRVFKLTCSNGHFTSNEYVQTLTVMHPHSAADAARGHPSGVADKMDSPRGPLSSERAAGQGGEGGEGGEGGGGGWAAVPRVFAAHARRDEHSAELHAPRVRDAHAPGRSALVIGVVCVGALLAAAAAAAARARPRAPAPDMAWDDSALTITLNPMEQVGGASCGVPAADTSEGESDSDSRASSDDEDDVEVLNTKQHKYRNVSQLEWDNSAM